MLSVLALTKAYDGQPVLKGVDLEIASGEIVGLLGKNGAGKTTFVSIVAALRRADSGSVRVGGIDPFVRPLDARRLLGLAPQELGIYPILSVRENLTLFAEVALLPRRVVPGRIEEVAEALGLTQFLGKAARLLSGGEKRRLHTAMALLHRPPLLLLDEPTTGVDVTTRANLLAVLRSLAAEGSAICYSTHYLPEIEALGASVAILHDGRIVARDTLAGLVARHGESAVLLIFEGEPPAGVPYHRPVEVIGNSLRIPTDDPAAEVSQLLNTFASAGRAPLRSVELVVPGLESVFLRLTGDDQRAGVPGERAALERGVGAS